MRRADKEIKDKALMLKILDKAQYITVAMCDNEEPYLVSLSHLYDKESNCIYFHCAKDGKKLDILRHNPRVWGQALVDYGYHEGECSHLYASVMIKGRVEFIEDYEKKKSVFERMVFKLDKDPKKLLLGLKGLKSPEGLKSVITGRIVVEEITGKKSLEVAI